MLSISHVATGAFVASKVSNPFLAIPIILGLHYLEDWIPHWDVGTGLSTGKRKKSHAIVLEVIELVMSFVLVFVFWHVGRQTPPLYIYFGGLMGIIPDLIEAPRNFLKWEPSFLRPLNEFHGLFHHSTPDMFVGLAPQVILLITIFLLK